MGFKIPEDGDFSAWEKQLNSKISGCSNRVSLDDMKLGRTMFSWLEDTNAAKKLADYMDNELKTTLTDYTNKRWYGIFVIVLGIVALIGAILIAWFARKRRKVFGQKPVYADKILRPTTRQRTLLRMVSWLLVLLALTSSIIVIVGSTQMLKGVSRVQCNGWLPIHAHYFGAQSLRSGDSLAGPVAQDWKGTIKIKEQLRSLEGKTIPVEENPVRQLLLAQKAAGVYNITMADGLQRMYFTSAWTKMYNHREVLLPAMRSSFGMIGKSETFHNLEYAGRRGAMDNLYGDWAVYNGNQRLQYVLDRYTAPDAFLMNTAYNAVQEALETIRQIDTSIGEFAKNWDHLMNTLNAMGKAIAALGIVLAVLTIAFACWAQAGTLKLASAVRRGVYPGVKFERRWRRIVVYAFFGFALSLVFFGINLLIAAVGNDACQLLDKDLLQDGRWTLMPEAVLYPNGKANATLDMRPVLDTCVRRGGDGSVALTMGLDGRIAEVSAHVDAAERELHEQIGLFSGRETRRAKARFLTRLYRDALNNINQPWAKQLAFPEVQNLFLVPQQGLKGSRATHFAFNIKADASEVMFGIALLSLTGNGLFYQYANVDEGYRFANQLAAYVHWKWPYPEDTPEEQKFPHGFCSQFAKALGVECYLPDEAPEGQKWVDLNVYQTVQDVRNMGQLVNTTGRVPLDWSYMGQNDNMLTRISNLVMELWRNEKFRNYVFQNGDPGVQCPDPTATSCTYYELLVQDMTALVTAGEVATQAVGAISDVLEGLLFKVIIPVLETLVEEANAITDDANCQVIGTALDHGVLPALCENFFPGVAISCAFWFVLVIIFLVGTHQAWTWASLMSHSDMPGEPDVVLDAGAAPGGKDDEGPPAEVRIMSVDTTDDEGPTHAVPETQANRLVSQDDAALTTAVKQSPPQNLTPQSQDEDPAVARKEL